MNNTRLNGHGGHAIDHLLESMAVEFDGSCFREPEGVRLSFPGGHRPEFVRYVPDTQQDWTMRLKWVEKQSAIFLLNTPIVYGLKWTAAGGKKEGNNGLRVSVGLSLSAGSPFPKRYTSVLRHGSNEVRISEGGRLPLGRGKESPVGPMPSWVQDDLQKLARGIRRACQLYGARPEVRQAILKLQADRRIEIRDIENLYRTTRRSSHRLYGLPAPGTDGSASIEEELRRLQNIVLRRYEVTVRVRPLSLVVLQGAVPREIYRNGELFRIPTAQPSPNDN